MKQINLSMKQTVGHGKQIGGCQGTEGWGLADVSFYIKNG